MAIPESGMPTFRMLHKSRAFTTVINVALENNRGRPDFGTT